MDIYKAVTENLTEEVGTIYEWVPIVDTEIRIDPETGLDPEFDREGLQALKRRIASERRG